MQFVPERALLNPKFEGYKLDALSQSEHVSSHPLPDGGATQATVSGHSQLSFKEVQHRIGFNHLFIGQGGDTVGYIDKSGSFILAKFGLVSNIFLSYYPQMTWQKPSVLQVRAATSISRRIRGAPSYPRDIPYFFLGIPFRYFSGCPELDNLRWYRSIVHYLRS
jgi:hypothetical protein